MDIFGFIATVVLLTASGALAPGPLFFATISHGARSGVKSGLIFSLSHTVVEFALIMVLAFGLFTVVHESFVRNVIGLCGGVVLLIFGGYQTYSSIIKKTGNTQEPASSHRLFVKGLLFTGLNPYFILWWFTVGSTLILMALELAGFLGVIFMFLCHIWMDYVWLGSVAYCAQRGVNAIGSTWYRVIIGAFGIILICFGFVFIRDVLIANI